MADIVKFPGVEVILSNSSGPPTEVNARHAAARELASAREFLSHALTHKHITLPTKEAMRLDLAIDKAIDALVYER